MTTINFGSRTLLMEKPSAMGQQPGAGKNLTLPAQLGMPQDLLALAPQSTPQATALKFGMASKIDIKGFFTAWGKMTAQQLERDLDTQIQQLKNQVDVVYRTRIGDLGTLVEGQRALIRDLERERVPLVTEHEASKAARYSDRKEGNRIKEEKRAALAEHDRQITLAKEMLENALDLQANYALLHSLWTKAVALIGQGIAMFLSKTPVIRSIGGGPLGDAINDRAKQASLEATQKQLEVWDKKVEVLKSNWRRNFRGR